MQLVHYTGHLSESQAQIFEYVHLNSTIAFINFWARLSIVKDIDYNYWYIFP